MKFRTPIVANICPITHGVLGNDFERNGSPRVAILITTFHRPKLLTRLLNSLESESESYHIEYFIYDDAVTNNGKHKFWKTINNLWQEVRDKTFDYYIHIQDDHIPVYNSITKAIELWESINDPHKIGLNILLDDFRVGKKVWIDQWPEIRHFNGNRFLLNPWLDMAFICTRELFDLLDWQIKPISMERWKHHPTLSSGVGAQISIRLFMKRKHMYQVTSSLVDHVGNDSKMNPEIRKQEPLNACSLPMIFACFKSGDEDSPNGHFMHSEIVRFVDKIFYFVLGDSSPPVVPPELDDRICIINCPDRHITLSYKVNSTKSYYKGDFYLFHTPPSDRLLRQLYLEFDPSNGGWARG